MTILPKGFTKQDKFDAAFEASKTFTNKQMENLIWLASYVEIYAPSVDAYVKISKEVAYGLCTADKIWQTEDQTMSADCGVRVNIDGALAIG